MVYGAPGKIHIAWPDINIYANFNCFLLEFQEMHGIILDKVYSTDGRAAAGGQER